VDPIRDIGLVERSDDKRDALERALGYPYSGPSRSFALQDGRVLDHGAGDVDRLSRTPLLAYGSNASPPVLAAKLGASADAVPVARATLEGFDAVYSAHLAVYGAVPATLEPSPGTTIRVFVAHVTTGQLETIAATEPNYELRPLEGQGPQLESDASAHEAVGFRSRHGCLLVDDGPVALASIAALGRRFPAMTQRQALEHVRGIVRPDAELAQFVLDWVSGEIPAQGLNRSESP
jgi:hypothetical protein